MFVLPHAVLSTDLASWRLIAWATRGEACACCLAMLISLLRGSGESRCCSASAHSPTLVRLVGVLAIQRRVDGLMNRAPIGGLREPVVDRVLGTMVLHHQQRK